MSGSILTVSTAATSRALCTVEAVKDELGITGSASDTQLAERILQASRAIEEYCGCTFARQGFTEIFRPMDRPDVLFLGRYPVASISSLIADGVTLTDGAGYEANMLAGLVYRLAGDRRICWRERKITAIYLAGYILPGDDGADLPENVSRACIMQVKAWWAGRGRDTTIRSESTDGVDTMSYFDPKKLSDEVAALLPSARVARL